MGATYRSKEHDPQAQARFGVQADARLRVSFTAMQLAELAESLVPLVDDAATSTPADMLRAAASIQRIAEQLVEGAVIHHLAAGGTWPQAAEAVDDRDWRDVSHYGMEPLESQLRTRYEEHWLEFEKTQPDHRPPDPQFLHLVRSLDRLDAWCATRLPDEPRYAAAVTGGLVWPSEPDGEVITDVEAAQREAERVEAAEREERMAQFRVEYSEALTAALGRLASKSGLAYTHLWFPNRQPYVVARDGRLLGTATKNRYVHGVRWSVDADGMPFEDRKREFEKLADAMDFLDRPIGAPARAAEAPSPPTAAGRASTAVWR